MNLQLQRASRALPGPISYRIHGPGDYFYRAQLQPDGRYRVEKGSFRSAPPRIGRIDADARLRIDLLLARASTCTRALDQRATWYSGPSRK